MNLDRSQSFMILASNLACAVAIAILFGSSSSGSEKADLAADKNGRVDHPAREASTTDLDLVLTQWAEESNKIQSLSGTCLVSEFNTVFETEKPSRCEFVFESRRRWRVDWRPAEFKRKAHSQARKNKNGEPFQLELGESKTLMTIDDEFFLISLESETYAKSTIPPGALEKEDFAIPVVFAAYLDVPALRRAYEVSLSKETTDQIALLARRKKPKTIWFRRWSEGENFTDFDVALENCANAMFVTLDKKTCLPSMIRLKLADGDSAYTFDRVMTNSTEDDGIAVNKSVLQCLNPYPSYENVSPKMRSRSDSECADALRPVSNEISTVNIPAY